MANTDTPSGEGSAGKVRGPLLPDKNRLGAHLRSGRIVAYTVAGFVIVGGAGFAAIDLFHGFGTGTGPAKEVIHRPPNIAPGQRENPSLRAPSSKTQSSTGPTASSRSAMAVTPVSTTQTPAQVSPQVTAMQQALKDTGDSSVTWGGAQQEEPHPPASPTTLGAVELAKLLVKKAEQRRSESVYSNHLVRREVSPYELLQGTVIPAILTQGIKSDLPGQVKAVVAHPVYNSLNASYVLIPAGSTLIGSYRNAVAMGQKRLGVEWTRIEFPNGTYIQLSHMPGTSPRGYAGFHDLVNDHTWEIFKNALLLSVIDVGMAVASPVSTDNNTTGVTGNEALQDGEQALAQTFGQAEAQLFQRYINVSPTLTIRPGYAFNVVVTKDLVFPGPYRHGITAVGTGTGPVLPGSPALPSEANPYA